MFAWGGVLLRLLFSSSWAYFEVTCVFGLAGLGGGLGGETRTEGADVFLATLARFEYGLL